VGSDRGLQVVGEFPAVKANLAMIVDSYRCGARELVSQVRELADGRVHGVAHDVA
jgi:hypothetical protein